MIKDLLFSIKRKCPVCKDGALFSSWFNFSMKDNCDVCGTSLKSQDVGDGAIVFLTFILGFTIVPAALIWEFSSAPPVWLQLIVWSVVSVISIIVLTPIIKAYIMLLQYRHRKSEWSKKKN